MQINRKTLTILLSLLLFMIFTSTVSARENQRSFYPRDVKSSMTLDQILSSKETCVECHTRVTPRVVKEHQDSVHASKGLNCVTCHGNDHTKMSIVNQKACEKCHALQTKEMMASKHANSWYSSWKSARYSAISVSMRQQGCARCHDLSYGLYEVKQVRCDYCHTSHLFSKKEAQSPLTCTTCHMGPDHPQAEAYNNSAHGKLYNSQQTGVSALSVKQAPTCITCHQVNGSHNVSDKTDIGGVSAGGALQSWTWLFDETGTPKMKRSILTSNAFLAARQVNLDNCAKCHPREMVKKSLESADDIKMKSDQILLQAQNTVKQLNDAGLLYPDPATRQNNSNTGQVSPKAGQELVLGGNQLYNNTSKAEAIYFEMFKFAGVGGWKSAYHQDFVGAEAKGLKNLNRLNGELQDEALTLKTVGAFKPTNDSKDSATKIISSTKRQIAIAVLGLILGMIGGFVFHFRRVRHSSFIGLFLMLMVVIGVSSMPSQVMAWGNNPKDFSTCASCHKVQTAQLQKGKHASLQCSSCHEPGAKLDQVKRPETCGKCHSGKAGYQLETYLSSPHGIKYRLRGVTEFVPTCATCHMSEGNHGLVQLSSRNISLEKSQMGKVCLKCHITDEVSLFSGDLAEIYKNTQQSVDELRGLGLNLIDKGLLVSSNNFDSVKNLKSKWGRNDDFQLAGLDSLTPKEQTIARKLVKELMDETKEGVEVNSVKTKIGTAHVNPDYSHWYGNAYLNLNLSKAKGTALELETLASNAGVIRRLYWMEIAKELVLGVGMVGIGFWGILLFFRKKRS